MAPQNPFDYRKPTDDEAEAMKVVSNHLKADWEMMSNLTPGSAELTLAMRAMQQARMWFNAAVIFHGLRVASPFDTATDPLLSRAGIQDSMALPDSPLPIVTQNDYDRLVEKAATPTGVIEIDVPGFGGMTAEQANDARAQELATWEAQKDREGTDGK